MANLSLSATNTFGLLRFKFQGPRLSAIARMATTANQRKRLSQLDPALLADIGLTSEQARVEANRPFWDAPRSWCA